MTLVVEARNLWVDYRKVSALKGADVDLPRGEFAVLMGPNGSGKTTLLRALAGTLTLSRGSVRVCGHDIISAPYPAKIATHDLSVAERYATRVLLLINGQLRKTWMRQELVNLREGSGKPLEQVLAEACRPDRAAKP